MPPCQRSVNRLQTPLEVVLLPFAVATPTKAGNVFGCHTSAKEVAAGANVRAGGEHLPNTDFRMVADQAAEELHAGGDFALPVALVTDFAIRVFQVAGTRQRAKI